MELPFSIGLYAIAQNKIMHAPTYIDRVDLYVAKVVEGLLNACERTIKPKSVKLKTTGLIDRECERSWHVRKASRILIP
jgi:hypothetical protein